MDDPYQDNSFEKFPGKESGEISGENLEKATEWENTMQDAPEFAGEEKQFGIANEANNYYGEATEDNMNTNEYNAGVSDAAALVNYGLNAAAREYGVENVVQKIKNFDASGSTDPIKDFYEYMGIDTAEEYKDVQQEAAAAKKNEDEFIRNNNVSTIKPSVQGAFAAIEDMKELIGEVEGADPRYEKLREGAKAAGKGYFDYAVSEFGTQGLTELFQVLSSQKAEAGSDEVSEDDSLNKDNPEPQETLNPEILSKE